ncbi:hypothetical protein [Natronosalvus rutilus]|uniref:Uncharacterized protein n=1 Tax=Natronosalvus rutilus TaxID=2953753 RepID=A0A9E7NAP3_9EURY|nr:hypothetical protein [Natronosalvus rutilus]UTF53448.1 hypothetical protein NGM29_17025 [Natronosalvus rutilus]
MVTDSVGAVTATGDATDVAVGTASSNDATARTMRFDRASPVDHGLEHRRQYRETDNSN